MSEQQLPQTDEKKSKRRWRPTRRGFLIGTGAVGTLLAVGIPLGLPIGRRRMFDSLEENTGGFGEVDSDPNAWFEVLPDSRIRLYITKVEMGQGVHTAIAQIGIEDLGIGWDDLEIVQASTHTGINDSSGTGGSWSVSSLYQPLREAAATLNHMLTQAAAKALDTSPEEIQIQNRAFVLTNAPDKSISLADVAALPEVWEIPEDLEIALKPQSEFEFIGQSMPRQDIVAKVTGQAVYGYDTRIDGMLYGAVARPPVLGVKMLDVDPKDAGEMPGVEQIVIDKEAQFVGVVAQSRAEAYAAIDAMEISWEAGKAWNQAELDAIITAPESGGVSIQKVGNPKGMLGDDSVIRAEYRTPYAIHCTLEPQAALADVRADGASFWVSDQFVSSTQGQLAELLEMETEQVEVTPAYLGGGFGRKLGTDVATEAARLSQAVGKPVHVGWNRTEDMRYGYFRPPTHSRLEAKLDENGKISAWLHNQASSDVAKAFLPGFLNFVFGADFGAVRGARIRYDVPNLETIGHHMDLPTPTGWWRGLGLMANTFANESFMDELAHAAGEDPLAFRLAHMPDNDWGRRMGAALEAVAERAGWGEPLPEGHAHGLACSTDVDTVVAMVAEVSLDEESGQIHVHKITCANECGVTINPDGAIAQIQGNIMWGVGSALIEEMQIRDGTVAVSNFGEYPLVNAAQAPDVDTVLLESGDGIPRGMGEPPIGPPPAAIANAFFSLTGVRLRDLPMTPERVLAAI